ncbi:acyltransferase family protein [Novosphingobium rosa]|uniref:acyltransferase family protein n=1 Tax=Novosphingobium rosa TaxID=76978 RepID=UPI001FDF6AA4|nr:acyltransferase [Novosphingobium rosa]
MNSATKIDTRNVSVPPSAPSDQQAPSDGTAPLDEKTRLSRAIGIARVICIMGIVYVHAWTGRNGQDLQLFNDTSQGLMRWALIDLMARSSVPLLSMISGWLVGPSFAKRGWRIFLQGKLRTVALPMVLWNALAILLVSGAAYLGLIYAPRPTTVWWTIDELFCLITPNDINVQIPFLRDLFVCMLAVPLLVRLPSKVLIGVALAAMAWSLMPVNPAPVVLQRPSILLFFIAGLLARRHTLAAWMASRPLLLVGMPYLAIGATKVWLEVVGIDRGYNNPLMLAGIDLAMRCATAIFFWSIAWRLAASRVAAPLLKIEPYMFLMFCAHLIMIWLFGPLIGDHIFGPIGSPAYPLFLLGQPFMVLGASVALGNLMMRVTPRATKLLSGGRLHASRL